MIELIDKPEAQVSAQISKWMAVHQPITFTVQRKDAVVEYRSPVGGFARFKLTSTVASGKFVGQKIFYKVGSFETFITITAVSGVYITTDWQNNQTVSGGFINFIEGYKNYYLQTDIFDPNTNQSIGTSRNRVDLKGVGKINTQEWLKQKANYQNDFQYNAVNKYVLNESGKFLVNFKEYYNGTSLPKTNYFGYFYWVNGNKQILEIYSGNMADYVPTPDATRVSRAKFITDFNKPTYFEGYPFSLSFIYSDNLANLEVLKKETVRDLNGNFVDTFTTTLNWTQRFTVNRLMLSDSFDPDIDFVDVWLETGNELTINALDGGTVTTGVFGAPSAYEQAVSTYNVFEE